MSSIRLRRPVLWLTIAAMGTASAAYMASNAVTTSGAGETVVSAVPSFTFDDHSPAIHYSGPPDLWTSLETVTTPANTSGDYDHTETLSAIAGASATVTFTGTAVQWIGPKEPNGGIADVSIDTGPSVAVDTYVSGSEQFQQVLYTVAGLTPGTHRLRIVVSGVKNPASTGYSISIDAINVPS